VLRTLRQSKNNVPVILMTSHGSEQVAVEVFRLGVQDYITKPFAVEEMLGAIESALYVTRLQREKEELTRRVMQSNQQLEQRLHELNILYKIGKSITALTDPETMLERIVDAVLFITNGDEGTLILVDAKNGQARKHVKKQRMGVGSRRVMRQPHPTGILMAAAARDEGVVQIGSENLLSAPLQLGQKIVGTLSVTKQNGSFTEYDEQLLRMLADYAAIAVHNLQLVRRLQVTKEREKQQVRDLFERYVSPTVVRQLLTQPGQVELGGKRKVVTILFADVRGFSAFSSRTSPEILIELLNQYMRIAADAVLAEQGTLDKFMGDAVMAFFNAPLTQPDHALRAVRAAWKLNEKVRLLHQYLPVEHRLHFGIGIGVGEVVVGNIGTSDMMNFTVIGDTVNKAKRLQENARGGQILISQELFYLLQNQVHAKVVPNVQLKGQSRPETVYEVTGLRG
jgi:class 3 adenylate cyclase